MRQNKILNALVVHLNTYNHNFDLIDASLIKRKTFNKSKIKGDCANLRILDNHITDQQKIESNRKQYVSK